MPLDGILRPGTGGGGAALLRHRPISGSNAAVVSSTAFGLQAKATGAAAVACSVTPGVPHTDLRDPAQEQLRLATLTADGRGATEEDGPPGHGIWFGAAPGDASYAIAVRGSGNARVVIANRWGTPGYGSAGWPILGLALPAPFAQAVAKEQFAAGVSPNGSLYVVAGGRKAAVLQVRPDGSTRTLPFASPVPDLTAIAMRRIVFQGPGRMLVTCLGKIRGKRPRPVAVVRALEVRATLVRVDTAWGTKGAWQAPDDFTPADLVTDLQDDLICPGWLTSGTTAVFSVVHIAGDGNGDDGLGPPQGPGVAEPTPIQAALDTGGALLLATTVPNLLSVFLPGLASMGLVTKRDASGQADTAFGFQGACFASHLGYPVAVRGIAATPAGFFLACDRIADIRWSDAIPVVFAFGPTGQAVASFGDVGIVHHEEIPARLQVHEGPDAVAVGRRRVFTPGGPDEFELALTRIGSGGHVIWQYGTTHGLRSLPLVVNGARVGFPDPTVLVRWNGLWAIGGSSLGAGPGGGFVTFRDPNGGPYPFGQGTALRIDGPVAALTPLPGGSLEVVYREGSPVVTRRTTISPAFVLDPNPVVVTPPAGGLVLPDGSRVAARVAVTNLGSSHALQAWLTRTRVDGSIDPAFGGGGANPPPLSRMVMRSGFPSSLRLDVPGGVLALPAGGFVMLVGLRQDFGVPPQSTPIGILATRWNTDGAPFNGWPGDGALHADFTTVTQVLVDHPAHVVVVGGALDPGTTSGPRPTLLGIRMADGGADPTLGVQGRLSPDLRGTERRVAHAALTRADGHVVVPVRVDDTLSDQPALIWLDVT